MSSYSARINTQLDNKSNFIERIHGSRKHLVVHGKLIATTSPSGYLDLGGLTKNEFASFLGLFNRKLYAQFIKFPELYDQDVHFFGVARHKNSKVWNSLPIGSYFYNLDMSSAYWQILYCLNYIDKHTFDSYINSSKHKTAKRYCVSFLARPNKSVYYSPSGEKIEITCDTSVLNRVYSNVRKELYRTVHEALIGIENYIEYNIDGVTVLKEDVDQVKKYFKGRGLIFKTTVCRKLSENEYTYGNKTRKFKTNKTLTKWKIQN